MEIEYRLDQEIGIDPYRADTEGRTAPRAYIRPWNDKILVIVEQTYPGQNGMDPDDFQDVGIWYGDNDSAPDPEAFAEYIQSEAAQMLIRRIAEGYGTDWPDPQRPGDGFLRAELDADAQEALDELDAAIQDLGTDTHEYWTAREWFSQTPVRQFTAGDIDEMIENPSGDQPEIVIIDDVEEYCLSEVLEFDPDEARALGYEIEVNEDDEIVWIKTPAGHEKRR